MNDDPEKVDILYGRCVENSGRLQQLADIIVDRLETDGLLDRQYERVKLHATLMNSLFKVKDDSEENTVRSTFNAKPILEVIKLTNYNDAVLIFTNLCICSLCMCAMASQNWKDYSFGFVSVNDIHLSQRYSTSQSTKYYVASSQIALNH